MADRGALTEVFLMAFAEEATKARGTPGGFFTPKGISGAKVSNPQTAIKSKSHLSARKRRRTSYIGEKSYSATFNAAIGDTFQTDWDKVIIAALGNSITDAALTESVPTATGFSFTGNAPMPIVLVTRNTGLKEALPVNSQAAGAATFGIQPVLGGDTISTVKNPIETSGKIYYVDPTANSRYFQIQSKYGSEPDGRTLIGLGNTIAKMLFKTTLQDILSVDMEFSGIDWFEDFDTYNGVTYTDNTADPGDVTNQFLSHMGVVYCQAVTPAAASDIEAESLEFDLAPTSVDRRGISPRQPAGTGALGSSVLSKRFGIHFENGVQLKMQYYSKTWSTRRAEQTELQLFFEFYNGTPQGSSTKRIAGWFPSVKVDDEPVHEDMNQLLGNTVKLNVLERALTGMQLSPFYLAFFGE